MRSLLTWLMVFGVLAGLNASALAANGSRVAVCSHVAEACEHGHHHDGSSDDHSHGESCPVEHHHHHQGACFQMLPLAVESERACALAGPAFSRLDIRAESESPPDAPLLSLDKPPLV